MVRPLGWLHESEVRVGTFLGKVTFGYRSSDPKSGLKLGTQKVHSGRVSVSPDEWAARLGFLDVRKGELTGFTGTYLVRREMKYSSRTMSLTALHSQILARAQV